MKNFLSFSLIILLITSGFAKDAINFEAFFTVDRISTPVVSPDGQWIAFSVKKADLNANAYQTQVWIMNSAGEDQTQVTIEGKSNSKPVFSKDSKNLYYISNRSGSAQVWSCNLKNNKHNQVTDVYDGIAGFVKTFALWNTGSALLCQNAILLPQQTRPIVILNSAPEPSILFLQFV